MTACYILQLGGLKTGCEDFMVEQVDLANRVAFHRFAELYQLHKVRRKAKLLMMAEFKAVAFTDQFNELSCSELVELIKDDDVSVDDEHFVVESMLKWVQHDVDNRKFALKLSCNTSVCLIVPASTCDTWRTRVAY